MGDTGKKGRLLQKIKDNQKEVWSSFFKMDKKIFQTSNSYYFNYKIQTDGVGVSLLFKHESIKDKKYGHKCDSPVILNNLPYLRDLSGEKWCFRLLGCKRCVEQKERKIGSQEDELRPNLSSHKLLTRDKRTGV